MTFTISVLWLSGRSIGAIAMLSGRSNGSIRGIVHRYLSTPRDKMSIEERQAELDRLKRDRRDEGRLADRYFVALQLADTQAPLKPGPSIIGPLSAYQKAKPAAPAPLPEPDARTREGRKEIQRRKQESRHQEKVAAERQAERELGGAVHRGLLGSALEYLHDVGTLADPADKRVDAPRLGGISSKERRKEAGRILRTYMDGCRIGGMSSVDFDRVGTGSNSRLAISAYRLQAIHAVGAIRQMMPERDFSMLEAIVDRDECIWETVPSSQAKTFLYEAIRRALDVVAVFEELMGRSAFAARWGYELPVVKGMDRDEARRVSNSAEQILRQA
ncbi:hypothetical protein NKJ09_23055 [Mesorhizobium sp. M0189]|uniref:hypothetical protein n=1 Tax=Mesorhizobium sp. M0189 TaxID=2956909 RepID=UPI003335DEE9